MVISLPLFRKPPFLSAGGGGMDHKRRLRSAIADGKGLPCLARRGKGGGAGLA